MKNPNVLSNLSSAALLDLLGLQSKPRAGERALTIAGFVAAGVVVGAAAALLLAPKSGRQTRTDLRQGAHELGERVSSTAAMAIDAVKHQAMNLAKESST